MTDPYFDTITCVNRLLKEYHEHGKLIVAVDFDDTVFDFHNAGHLYVGVIDLLHRCQSRDFYICLFTGTNPQKWESQKEYLAEKGIMIHSVNRNPFPLPFGNAGKMYYNILLDDRSGLGQAYNTLTQVLDTIDKETNENLAN